MSEMGWNNLENTLIQANAKMTHKIIHEGVPEIISHHIKSKLPDPDIATSTSEKKTKSDTDQQISDILKQQEHITELMHIGYMQCFQMKLQT